MLKVVSIINNKGGVGKSTSAINMSISMAKKGNRVLLVDADTQGNATLSLLEKDIEFKGILHHLQDPKNNPLEEVIVGTFEKNLFMIPQETRIDGVPYNISAMLGEDDRESFFKFKQILSDRLITKNFDVVIIDLPPSKDTVCASALVASTHYIVPMEASDYGIRGLQEVLTFANDVSEINPQLELAGIIFPIVDSRVSANKKLIKSLSEQLPGKVIPQTIGVNSKINMLVSRGLTIFDLNGKESRTADEYIALTKVVMEKIGLVQRGVFANE